MTFVNPAKQHLREGKTIINGWLHIPSPLTAEAMAHAGFDTLTLDLQHGPYSFEAVLPMLQAMNGTPIAPLARVPWNEPGMIMKLLDAGCYGLICPMINTPEQCDAFVKACRYPPLGYRSFGPTRVRLHAGNDYAKVANSEILTLAMIETAEALENLEAIMSVPGLDGVYVGPADLSQSLGGAPGADWQDGPVLKALETVLELARKHDIVAGVHTMSVGYARRMSEWGYRFVTVQSDLTYLTTAAKAAVSELTSKRATGPSSNAASY